MKSAIYLGSVFHKRERPKAHRFTYSLCMFYLDLDEISCVSKLSRFCSDKPWSVLRIKREDFHGDPDKSIKSEVYRTVKDKLGITLNGPVRALSHWRLWGVNFNPLSTYYCFDESGERLVAILAEVTNTPWFERQAYAIKIDEQCKSYTFDKVFTVSPFNPVNMRYLWRSSVPGSHLNVSIDTYQLAYSGTNQNNSGDVESECLSPVSHTISDEDLRVHASMSLERHMLTRTAIHWVLLKFPFNTLRVIGGIYWEALRLFIKGVPFLGKNKIECSGAVSNVNDAKVNPEGRLMNKTKDVLTHCSNSYSLKDR